MTTYLLIGAGKLAKHLQNYFSLLSATSADAVTHPMKLLSWDRSQDPHLLKTKISEASHVLLAISDSALPGFYRLHLAGLDKTVVHFSGALTLEDTLAAHPLMSFGPELYPLETYRRIHFAISGCSSLAAALPGLPNSFSVLDPEKKPLYHALCVMGGNFPVILWQKMFSEFATLGIPAEAASVYLQTVLVNTLQNPGNALTGPLARRDATTVSKNLEALNKDPFQEIYRAFVQAVAPELLTSSGPLPQKERPQ